MSPAAHAEALADPDYRLLARDEVGDLLISTAWIGLHQGKPLGRGSRPLIFETRVEGPDDRERDIHYATEAEAVKGHEETVSAAKRGLDPSRPSD
jgi:hypothetical protein